ncbi:MAG TPA: universal stress protein [Burkholderiales bacterium]
MIRKILLAYDGSEPAKKAFEFALDLARKYEAQLQVLTVVRPPEFAEDVETEAVIENSRAYHEKLQTPLALEAAAQGVKASTEVAVGHPAEQIIYAADRYRADLIVVGHRGKTLFQRLLLGSVSKQVIQYAGRAVLVVR